MGRAGFWGAAAFLVVLVAVAAVLLVVVPLVARRRGPRPVDFDRERREAAERRATYAAMTAQRTARWAAVEARAAAEAARQARRRARWVPVEVPGDGGATEYRIRRVAELPDGTSETVGDFHVRTVPAVATLSEHLDAQGAAIALADEHNERT